MRVAIDVSSAIRIQGTGVALYIKNLCRALAQVAPEGEFFLYYRFSRVRKSSLFLKPPGPNFKELTWPAFLTSSKKPDITHGPDARLLRLGRAAQVATVHDVFSLVSDRWADAGFRRKKAARYARIARSARLVICDSESTARDFLTTFPEASGKLRVVPLGAGPEFAPRSESESSPVLARLGIRRPYILHLGNIAVRKNLLRLIGAFEALAPAYPQLQLVLAGRPSYGHEEILAKVKSCACRDRISLPGYVGADDLPFLYSAAQVFVIPSLYEGFGLPALEALACGTPVVASNTSSLPEVTGEAAVLVNPQKEMEIAGGIDKLLSNPSLRAKLARAGRARAKTFTWEQTAKKTLTVYREAVS